MTREKHVYKTDEIAHLWANQTQNDARNPQGNLFFEGNTLYSYRHSWRVGVIVTNDNGNKAVVINSDTYSVTTSKHTSDARYASRHHMVQFTLPLGDYQPNYKEAQACFNGWYQKQIGLLLAKAKRARENKSRLVAQAENLKTEANSFAKFFGLTSRIKDDRGMSQLLKDAEEQLAKDREKRKERDRLERIAQAARNKELQDNLIAWKAGESINTYQLPREEFASLRIKNDNIETSMGAVVPVKHALILYRFMLKLKTDGKTWQTNGHTFHIGIYSVSKIDADGTLHAGCHVISWAEVERIGKLLEAYWQAIRS
jgi:hypothetical protein